MFAEGCYYTQMPPESTKSSNHIRIVTVRDRAVVLDSDLAALFGVSTKAFNQALKRNRRRFPGDFAFQLNYKEVANLRSQSVTSSLHGGRRYAPWVFSEHGAIMAATILDSDRAVAMSVYVVRTFISLRRELLANSALESRLQKIEGALLAQDSSLREIYGHIELLLRFPLENPGKEIGFHTIAKNTQAMPPASSLAKKVFNAAHITGSFLLRSGAKSTEYFDKYRFEANPAMLAEVARELAKRITGEYDALAGLEMGGIPVATMLSQATGKPMLLVRKKAKEYGTCRYAEGGEVKGRKLLIVEDVVTSGGAILDAVRPLRADGAIISNVVCVIDRQSGGAENLAKEGLALTSLFTMSELKAASGP